MKAINSGSFPSAHFARCSFEFLLTFSFWFSWKSNWSVKKWDISYLIFWPREHHSINCLIQQDEPTARGINLNKLPHYIHEITEDEASGNQLTISKTICPHYYLLYGRKSRLIILKACLLLFAGSSKIVMNYSSISPTVFGKRKCNRFFNLRICGNNHNKAIQMKPLCAL